MLQSVRAGCAAAVLLVLSAAPARADEAKAAALVAEGDALKGKGVRALMQSQVGAQLVGIDTANSLPK